MSITINLNLDKNSVGLGNVDNTSDVNKPISNATQTALNSKQESGDYATNTALTEGLATKQPTGDYATNTALTNGLATKQNTIAPLVPYDYWYETRFINLNTLQQHLVGTAIASGTALVAPPVVASNPFPYGCYVRSSASANSGYRFASGLANNDYFGVSSHKYQEVFMYRTSLTGITRRIGYGDTANQLDCVDGAYFETVGTTVNCKTSNNSTRTTVTMVATLSVDIPYLFDIEVNELGTLATFKLINGITGVEIESRTISTNIPTATTRGFGVMSVSTQVTAGIADIGIFYYTGNGTVAGFNRQRN